MYQYKSNKIRIYPNESQKLFIDQNIILCRQMYNILLFKEYQLYDQYLKLKESNCLDKVAAQKEFFKVYKRPVVADIKKSNDKFKLADSLSLEYEQYNIKMAFKKYFNSDNTTPKFKKRKDKNSYTTRNVNNNIKIGNEYIILPKLGKIALKGANLKYLNQHICTVVVSEEKNGKYYVDVTFRKQIISKTIIIPISTDKSNVIGLDFKVGSIFTSSTNFTPEYHSKYHLLLSKLKKLEHLLKRKDFLSKNWYKITAKIRNLHKDIANYRKDFQHKLSTKLCNTYDYIVIESLNLQDIAQKLKNGTNTYDTSYGLFTQKLMYKVKGKLIKINKWYPSSQLCSNCGHRKTNLTLSDRTYICDECNQVIDRDLNAAINIKAEGLRMLTENS